MMSYGQRIITKDKPLLEYLQQAMLKKAENVGLSDGSVWKARSGRTNWY